MQRLQRRSVPLARAALLGCCALDHPLQLRPWTFEFCRDADAELNGQLPPCGTLHSQLCSERLCYMTCESDKASNHHIH